MLTRRTLLLGWTAVSAAGAVAGSPALFTSGRATTTGAFYDEAGMARSRST